jgi:hypothetical protein
MVEALRFEVPNGLPGADHSLSGFTRYSYTR